MKNVDRTTGAHVPLVVYLDSSDWSNLASAAGTDPFAERQRWLSIRERLDRAKSSGKAEFRFSNAIVVEAYPTSPPQHEHGIARARVISELCGPLCLLEVNTLSREEARHLARGNTPPFPRGMALRNDRGWPPNPDDMAKTLATDLGEDLKNAAREIVAEALPEMPLRNRNEIMRQMITRDGRLTALAKERIPPFAYQEVANLFAERFGLPQDLPGLEIPFKVMLGELPPAELGEFFARILRDLPTLFALDETRQHADGLFGWLRKAGQDLAEPFSEVRSAILANVETFGLGVSRKLAKDQPMLDVDRWRGRIRERLLKGLWESESKRPRRERARGEAWAHLVIPSKFGSIPSLDAFLSAAGEMIRRSIVPSAQPRQPRVSDVGDLLHMSYLPYVDVFRCDGFGAGIAAEVVASMDLSVRVAATIEDALAAIGA